MIIQAHNLELDCLQFVYQFKHMSGQEESGRNNPEAKRLRWLRHAEGFKEGAALFARRLGWSQSQLSNYENGDRRVPRDAALQMLRVIPGFSIEWLWTGEERGLSFDLRRRIEVARAEEEMEHKEPSKTASSDSRTAS